MEVVGERGEGGIEMSDFTDITVLGDEYDSEEEEEEEEEEGEEEEGKEVDGGYSFLGRKEGIEFDFFFYFFFFILIFSCSLISLLCNFKFY